MVKKLQVALALQPVATAMFANSPFTEGRPNGFLSFRSEIWQDTDPRPRRHAAIGLRGGSASNVTSITRSTCRCISSSAASSTSTSRASLPRPDAGPASGNAGRARNALGLANHISTDLSGGPSQALSGNAWSGRRAVAVASCAAGLLGRNPLRRCCARCSVGPGQRLDCRAAAVAARRGAKAWLCRRDCRSQSG